LQHQRADGATGHDVRVATDVLSVEALNRASLTRQLLLERAAMAPQVAVSHLVGLQAQNPLDPYLALWSRLQFFDAAALSQLIESRSLVRIVVMRGTIHLVTADDALVLRPLMQPVLDAEIARHSQFAPHLVGVDIEAVVSFARVRLAERPLTGPELRAVLAERFPALHAPALSYACRCLLPLVQVPPRGLWGRSGQVNSAVLESWIGRSLSLPSSIDDLVVRYLAAFGPATAADASAWTRLTGMREVFDRLRPRLRVFRDDRNRELFDLPDAPRPSPDTATPVRFLPEYDNVLLSHADRSRFSSDRPGALAGAAGPYKGAVLVDGTVHAIWHSDFDQKTKRATIVVEHLRLPRSRTEALEAEAHRTAEFWHDAAAVRDVRLLALD
jgi:hypothetical protein